MTDSDLKLQMLRQIADALHELVVWTRVTTYPAVKQSLEAALDTDEKLLVYQQLDGTRSVSEIHELTGVNVRYISEWGQEWETIGIVGQTRASKRKGRRERLFDLAAYGIAFAQAPARSTE